MELTLMRQDLKKFQAAETITIAEALGGMQNIVRDINRESDALIENCDVGDPEQLMKLLLWLGNLYLRIYDKNRAVLDLSHRIDDYKKRETQLRRRIEESEGAVGLLDKLRVAVEELEQQTANLTNEADILEVRKADLIRQNQWKAEENASRKQEIRELEQAGEAVAGEARELERLRQEAIEEHARLIGQRNSSQESVENARSLVEGLAQETEKVQEDAAALERQVATLREKKVVLAQSCRQMMADLGNLQIEIAQYREKIDDMSPRVKKLSEEKIQKQEDADALEAEIETLLKDLRILREEQIPAMDTQQSDLLLEKNRTEESLREKKQAIEDGEQKLREFRAELEAKDRKRAELDRERRRYTDEINAMYKGIESMNHEIKQLQDQRKKLQEDLGDQNPERMTQELESQVKALEDRRAQCHRLNDQIRQEQEKAAALEAQVRAKERQLEEHKQRAQIAQQGIQNAKTAAAGLVSRKETLERVEARLASLKEIHLALLESGRLQQLPGMEPYALGQAVDTAIQSVEKQLTGIRTNVAQYVALANTRLEEIR